MKIKDVLIELLPRFVTEEIGVSVQSDGTAIQICYKGEELCGDSLLIDHYVTVKQFAWLGFRSGGKAVILDG